MNGELTIIIHNIEVYIQFSLKSQCSIKVKHTNII